MINSLAGLTTKKTITIYAVWKPVTSAISFETTARVIGRTDLDVDDVVAAEKAKLVKAKKLDTNYDGMYNTAITLPKLTVPGFTFLGWVDMYASDADVKTTTKNGITFVTQILKTNTQPITLVPYFTENTYKVMINPNGGMIWTGRKYAKSSLLSQEVKYRDPLTFGDIDAYNEGSNRNNPFVTLDKAGTKGTAVGATELVAKNNGSYTVYLQWTKNDVPVKPVITEAKLTGTTVSVKLNVTPSDAKPVYVQCSPSPKFAYGVESKRVSGGNIEFVDKTGTAYYVRARQMVKYTQPYGEYPGYVSGAYSATVRASKAGVIIPKVTITFDANLGETTDPSVVITPATKKIESGAAIGTLPTATRTGYDLEGWYKTTEGSLSDKLTEETTFDASQNVWAKWTAKKYTLTFDLNYEGAAAATDVSNVEYGTKVSAKKPEDPTRTGYTFDGWYATKNATTGVLSDKVDDDTLVTDVKTYYAKWTPKQLVITFDVNGGGGTAPTTDLKATVDAKFAADIVNQGVGEMTAPENKVFGGWALTAGGEAITADTVVPAQDEAITLYAVWNNAD